MAQSLVITLREGLEAALIVSIVLAYLVRINYRRGFVPVWWGVAGAVLLSIVGGAIIFSLGLAFEGRAEEIFEGTAMLLAVVVLSWMVVWMKSQARNIRSNLEAQVRHAVTGGSTATLAGVAFLAVTREGLETALFMFAAYKTSTPVQTLMGGLIGLAIAIALGVGLFRGSRRLNLRTFFNYTGVVLILIAGGMLAHGIHEFQEARVLPIFVEHLWNINSVLDEKSGVGSFLKGIFGYNGNPSLTEVVAYAGFLVTTLVYFFRPKSAQIPASQAAATEK